MFFELIEKSKSIQTREKDNMLIQVMTIVLDPTNLQFHHCPRWMCMS